MKNLKSHFRFNKQERSGIFFLLLIIILLQVGYFVVRSLSTEEPGSSFALEEGMQAKIDVLKKEVIRNDSVKIYSFNPNFISDYKGYVLGMSVNEINRLHTFRAQNKYVNSSEDFQKVTMISDSLLNEISPYFKFPDWTKKNRNYKVAPKEDKAKRNTIVHSETSAPKNQIELEIKDLNTATAEELKSINGIGEKLSNRIIKFRDRLGGFLVDEQLYDVYFLKPDVAQRVLVKFKVFNKPVIGKININTASTTEIASLVYIKYTLAEEIVSYREVNGPFLSLNELKNIEGFPTDKISRIALYLSL